MIQIVKSNVTRCVLFTLVYTVVLAWGCGEQSYLMGLSYFFLLFMFIPAPIYFAIFGGIRQGIYKNKHRYVVSTLMMIPTIIVTWVSIHYIVDTIMRFGMNGIYWDRLWGELVDAMQLGFIAAGAFFTGSLAVRLFQRLGHSTNTKNKSDQL